MAQSSSSNAGIVKCAINWPEKNGGTASPYDTSMTIKGHQVLRIPPTAATRDQTPTRPVYDDFETAHSSITSRSTNSRSRGKSQKSPRNQTGLIDRGRPLSRRTQKSLRRPKKQPISETMALPTPVKVPNHRIISDFDFDISAAHFPLGRQNESKSSMDHSLNVAPSKRTSVSPFLGSIKKAVGNSSPFSKPFKTRFSLTFKLPRNSVELSSLGRAVDQPARKELEDCQIHKRSLQQLDDTRPPELPFYLDDPFVYNASQDLMLGEGAGIGNNEAHGTSQLDRERTGLQESQNVGLGQRPSQDDSATQAQQIVDYYHGGTALAVGSQVISSTREGSTVDNIVKQYARNNGLWDISLDSNDEDSEEDDAFIQNFKSQKRVQNGVSCRRGSGCEDDVLAEEPFRAFKLADSSGEAPSTVLPQIPSGPDQRTLKSASEGLGQSSSYGDTQKLLDITQHSHWVTATDPPNFQAGVTPHLGKAAPSSTNPFRRIPKQNHALPSINTVDSAPNSLLSTKVVMNVSDNMDRHSSMPCSDLEREVSRALRRMSAFSSSSQETPALYPGDGGFQSSTDSSGLLSFIGRPKQRTLEPAKLVTRGFYHESAIRQTWLDSQRIERVRVPICRNGSSSSSLPVSHSASSASDEFDINSLDDELEHNGTEWETVVDGAVDRIKTAGSSLANNSSAGDISPILYQHNDFSSTDRIVQHPAQIEYSHDYRYREIKEGNFPVLLPSYKPHTVNGFPANSLRFIGPFQQSPADLYQPPSPLPLTHTNPFRSPPPEVISKKSASSEILYQDTFLLGQDPTVKIHRVHTTNDNRSASLMDEFSYTGPAIRPAAPPSYQGATEHSIHSHSESYFGSQIAGSSIADPSSSALSTIILELENLNDIREHGVSKSNDAAPYIDHAPPIARERALFVKGPPGAFYQGVRSRPDPHRKDLSMEPKAMGRLSQRKAAQNYPTNKMRPLSLLQIQSAELIVGGDRSQPDRTLKENFLYRSPLAPIKSKTWCSLYTKAQLKSMHTDAKNDNVGNFEYLPRRSSPPVFGEALKQDGSWKRTWSPHLHPWPRDNSSIKTDLSGRKMKLSSLIFGLCCLFPPLLVLYGLGYLDSMILWITEGEISSLSKAHKKAALQVACFFICTVLIAIPVIVVVKVIESR